MMEYYSAVKKNHFKHNWGAYHRYTEPNEPYTEQALIRPECHRSYSDTKLTSVCLGLRTDAWAQTAQGLEVHF